MKKLLRAGVGIKASGRIKAYECARALILAGAEWIGTSSGVSISESTNAKE